jgi:hypothetical protein
MLSFSLSEGTWGDQGRVRPYPEKPARTLRSDNGSSTFDPSRSEQTQQERAECAVRAVAAPSLR